MNQTNQHRRQLLKVGAGVPVVLTVQPGTSVAASSSMCAVKDAQKTNPAPAQLVAAPDNWLRCEVTQQQITNNGIPPDVKTYVQATGNGGQPPSVTCSPIPGSGGDWYLVNPSGDGVVTPQTPIPDASFPPAPYVKTGAATTRSALVFYEQGTGITGLAWNNPPDGQQITVSCLSSFA
jgi:hypothetical protein